MTPAAYPAPAVHFGDPRPHRFPKAVLAAFIAFSALALLLQSLSGAYRAELAGQPDEPAHFVTGLMMHDYLRTWPPAHPVRFAENFYLHYPKMALGHWPPVFYIMQALWTLVFPASINSVLVLMALLAAALATILYRLVASEYGKAAGFACGVALLLLPTIQEFTGMVMTEIPVALFCLAATIFFGRYIEGGCRRDSAWFGVFASLAIMTKGSGLALALVPPFAILFTRRFDLFRNLRTYLPAAMVAVLCGPWYVFTFDMQQNGWVETADSSFLARSFPFNAQEMVRLVGAAILCAAAAGIFAKLVLPFRGRRVSPKWAALGALILAVFIFQSLVPASLDIRHLTTAAPATIAFAAAGIDFLAKRHRFARWSPRASAAALSMLLAAVFAVQTFAIPKKGDRGFTDMVKDIISRPEFANSVILVSSQFDGEGIFISEMAMREKRPGHIVLRAGKVLADAQWNGHNYHVLFPDAAAVMRYMESVPVTVLVMDNTPGFRDHLHHRQLEQVLREYSTRWKLLGTYPKDGRPRLPGENVRVYQMIGENRPGGPVHIDVGPIIRRTLDR